jgi:FkbM family methyltransferase
VPPARNSANQSNVPRDGRSNELPLSRNDTQSEVSSKLKAAGEKGQGMRTDSVISSTGDESADAIVASSQKAKPWDQGIMARVAANLWLLTNFKDWASINAMKGRSKFGGVGELRIRGLERPLIFRQGTTDIPVVWELFHNAEYECDPWPFRTVVDCGANVGFFLAWLKRRGGQIDRYVGVEADAESFCVLEKQLAAMQLGERGSIVNAAIWNRNGQVNFDTNHDSWGRHVSTVRKGIPVQALTLDAVLDAAGLPSCDLLKLDIEGAEAQVLPYVAKHCAHRVECIVAELHGDLDYHWFSAVVGRAGFIPFPTGSLFKAHPGAVRRDSKLLKGLVQPGKCAPKGASPLAA